MEYPVTRLRRLRKNHLFRGMLRETELSVRDFIYPLFVCPGKNVKEEIPSMPGVYHLSVDMLAKELEEVSRLSIPGVIFFGLPERKDASGSEAWAAKGSVQQAVSFTKANFDNLLAVTDVCLCQYTDHGHCGLVKDGTVLNDESVELLAKTALSHAEAGADMVAPSDMMDGRVGAIREILNSNGFADIPVMSYAAKYSSAFYGPFRDAAHSAPQFGDRKSYQMDPANSNEALREVEQDLCEGADIVMVKPALSYLDIIKAVKDTFMVPVAAYNVSGEYSMIKAAAEKGWLNYNEVMMETLVSIKRAGADIILTYFAKDAARLLS